MSAYVALSIILNQILLERLAEGENHDHADIVLYLPVTAILAALYLLLQKIYHFLALIVIETSTNVQVELHVSAWRPLREPQAPHRGMRLGFGT